LFNLIFYFLLYFFQLQCVIRRIARRTPRLPESTRRPLIRRHPPTRTPTRRLRPAAHSRLTPQRRPRPPPRRQRRRLKPRLRRRRSRRQQCPAHRSSRTGHASQGDPTGRDFSSRSRATASRRVAPACLCLGARPVSRLRLWSLFPAVRLYRISGCRRRRATH